MTVWYHLSTIFFTSLRSPGTMTTILCSESSKMSARFSPLNEQCHEIFYLFFLLKRFYLAKTVLRTFLFSRRYSRKTCVPVVNGYLETFGKFWRFLTDFKGTICQKKVFRCVYTIHKSPYLKTKSGVRVVVDIF